MIQFAVLMSRHCFLSLEYGSCKSSMQLHVDLQSATNSLAWHKEMHCSTRPHQLCNSMKLAHIEICIGKENAMDGCHLFCNRSYKIVLSHVNTSTRSNHLQPLYPMSWIGCSLSFHIVISAKAQIVEARCMHYASASQAEACRMTHETASHACRSKSLNGWQRHCRKEIFVAVKSLFFGWLGQQIDTLMPQSHQSLPFREEITAMVINDAASLCNPIFKGVYYLLPIQSFTMKSRTSIVLNV